MRQIVRALRDGKLDLLEVAERQPGARHVLVRTSRSLISAGTERTVAHTASASLLGKARAQPDRVRQVIEKAATDGIGATRAAVESKLDSSLALGYASAGLVVAVGPGVTKVTVGDLVASNGPHGELVEVSQNLCVRVPDGVAADEAAFATVAAIGLQGIRLAAPSFGETVVVVGLGLVGLLTTQLLRASGCRVIGVDPVDERRKLAASFGAITVPTGDALVGRVLELTSSVGADAVLITASTSSNEPVHQAAQMSRKRGRIVLVGVAGLDLQRADFYEKELSFQVSCSYGPGRYDPAHEEDGLDYPVGFVRWTEGRNMEAVVAAMAAGDLDVRSLITHRFAFDRAGDAYAALDDPSALGVVLEYGDPVAVAERRPLQQTVTFPVDPRPPNAVGTPRIGLIGAGAFATGVLVPALLDAGGDLRVVASAGGTSGSLLAKRFDVPVATTRAEDLFEDPDLDAVVIATRHSSHAQLAATALEAGKHVFVEKPLATTFESLQRVARAAAASGRIVHIGFNRRFAPITQQMVRRLRALGPQRMISIVVNAGAIPADHWTQDRAVGGGRIIGEGCHFIDLARALAGSPIMETTVNYADSMTRDTASINLRFEDGAVASIAYVSVGNKRYPKETVTVFAGEHVLENGNFRRLRTWPSNPKTRLATLRPQPQDKGHAASVRAFLHAVRTGGPAPIPLDELLDVSFATLVAGEDPAAVSAARAARG